MELFYTTPKNLEGSRTEIALEGDEFHHLVRVVRKKPGDEVLLTDGNGSRFHVRIREIGKQRLTADILTRSIYPPSPTAVTVAMSLLKTPHRFDLFLEKATELGVTAIIPMITARTIALPPKERIQGKLDRWQGIVLSASRQSKRLFLPRIHEPLSFAKVLDRDEYDLRILAHESSEQNPLIDFAEKNVLFMIGPEGGFTSEEVSRARSCGVLESSLGHTILRAETAGVFAVAMVRARLLETPFSEKWL
ncbi:16S rRNA (uracil(1498)-N(3))-methyltransferase [Chlorobium phaeobacteroides]|uniref:Ribosomal RNA small subunit methyltransferase E n=1 Tax=Chlorobium phaeobacteroides (strain DSM 266 / SMG 266 / 2430) TaxID=290317 RepID=A1BIY1_CHLPD|nr:16S rRNA (uracil(1498)-N(3))-methyltransferase [Chlorobium phaeobacteroides]ABL66358.1 protein of unknown function DUF558 [Chlorobium phaeobacteroides DSM 266]